MTERWVIEPAEDDRVNVIGLLGDATRVVARSVLLIDAEIMVARQEGLASQVQQLRTVVEWALLSGQHHVSCPTRKGVDGVSACQCWQRGARTALEQTAITKARGG